MLRPRRSHSDVRCVVCGSVRVLWVPGCVRQLNAVEEVCPSELETARQARCMLARAQNPGSGPDFRTTMPRALFRRMLAAQRRRARAESSPASVQREGLTIVTVSTYGVERHRTYEDEGALGKAMVDAITAHLGDIVDVQRRVVADVRVADAERRGAIAICRFGLAWR